jgi:endonuclease/exonuclease/phosphatase (EEP) superfamily protein YafD
MFGTLLGLLFMYLRIVAAYTLLLSVSLVILGIVLFVLGVVVKQGNMIQRELWLLQSNQLSAQRPVPETNDRYEMKAAARGQGSHH